MMAQYTSMFKIDGKPILPPLMTVAKRYEMQMYREKAIQLELNLKEGRHERGLKFRETPKKLTPQEELGVECLESASDSDEHNKTLTDSAFLELSLGKAEMRDFGTNTQSGSEDDTKERMLKLSKSETVCFDVNVKTVMGKLTKEQMEKLRLIVEKAGNATKVNAQKGQPHIIPLIKLNPPTPMSGPKNICDGMRGSETVDTSTHSDLKSSQPTVSPVLDNSDDSSADLTETTISSKQIRPTSSASRMLHFEPIQNEELACQEVDADSPEGNLKASQRSATSPSLKSLSADDTSTHSLVRSSSFTLDRPSKVLLDHIDKNIRESAGKECGLTYRFSNSAHHTPVKERSPRSPSAWRDTVESKAKRVPKKVDAKPSIPRSKSKNTFQNYATNAAVLNKAPPPLKIKRSPYDSNVKIPCKAINKTSQKTLKSAKHPKSNTAKKSASSTTYTVQPTVTRPSQQTGEQTANDGVMSEIDLLHRQKLLALLTQQQEEQRRLQHTFESEQRMLLEQLCNEKSRDLPMSTDISKPALPIIDGMSPVQSIAEKVLNFNLRDNAASSYNCSNVTSSLITPDTRDILSGLVSNIRVELPYNFPSEPIPLDLSSNSVEEKPPTLNYSNDGKSYEKIGLGMENNQPQFLQLESAKPNLDRINAAASTINAYARGFLVRRLFQTEQIQRIVQTIRDTLIFVLNLHMETMENPKEANTTVNIKLKARLLQQLASASRTLHLIFFQTSVKERMEIIARDRKRIKAKLLSRSLKRSPRVA